MTTPRKLACKDSLVYVPIHSLRTCCQSRHERPYMHRKVIFENARIYLALYLLFNCMNAINYLIISYFGAVLFPFDLVTKRAMLAVARRASSRLFSLIFSARRARSIGGIITFSQRFILESKVSFLLRESFSLEIKKMSNIRLYYYFI